MRMAAWVTAGLPPTGLIDGSSVAVDGFVRMFGTLAIVALLAAYAALLVFAIRSQARARAHRRLDGLRALRPVSRRPRRAGKEESCAPG